MIVAGSTGCGKTQLIKKLIDFKMIYPFPSNIIWCYGAYQALYREMRGIEFYEGLPPDINSLSNALIVIDDLMSELSGDSKLTKLFTKGSHHRNLSVIFVVQNVFYKGIRDISLNAHYMFLFKNPRDKSQVMNIGKQLYPGKSKFFREVYEDATSKPFSYLLIDLKPDTSDSMRLRSGLFPGDTFFVYQPR
ncbi:uncharacterized protein TNIN_225411 [Trichonephila inaurata madagascariensis]|uniref:Uncharacterized protein n=1 Tax=Trichonephila inaurata madagascariensis TaxID=2747483 RepID=A0A8X7CC34_9ARAC|nr:uncharacterized protein TNIN_388911 [Trichonephila inaurata madagascariensis]GFY60872.1 uncharacterized protein TNIN_418201 [Trichonephila inaurata madagascariensis]GFY74896.1 uncharacterized protein TNIN_225411 [Trichonephila inaurata madagascariensis]